MNSNESITFTLREQGGCGAISEDGNHACILLIDHDGIHGFEDEQNSELANKIAEAFCEHAKNGYNDIFLHPKNFSEQAELAAKVASEHYGERYSFILTNQELEIGKGLKRIEALTERIAELEAEKESKQFNYNDETGKFSLYDEDGYCVCCGNGQWKNHMPGCELADKLDELRLAKAVVEAGRNTYRFFRSGDRTLVTIVMPLDRYQAINEAYRELDAWTAYKEEKAYET